MNIVQILGSLMAIGGVLVFLVGIGDQVSAFLAASPIVAGLAVCYLGR